jgi:hypothetical protein
LIAVALAGAAPDEFHREADGSERRGIGTP